MFSILMLILIFDFLMLILHTTGSLFYMGLGIAIIAYKTHRVRLECSKKPRLFTGTKFEGRLSKTDILNKVFNIGKKGFILDKYSKWEITAFALMILVPVFMFIKDSIQEQFLNLFDLLMISLLGIFIYIFICHNLFRPVELAEKYKENYK